MSSLKIIPGIISKLYTLVTDLEEQFPGRHFTPDGHLVGSIGEVLAAFHYNLELLPASAEKHDAVTKEQSMVQIKATQINSIGISSEPNHLLVLKIHKDGSNTEIYNGPGNFPWQAAGPMQKNGQRRISLSRLTHLMLTVPLSERLPREDE